MAIRTINYEVSANSITPVSRQFGGIQGEHNVTELVFKISKDLRTSIKNKVGNNTVLFRFDGYTGAGEMKSTVPASLNLSSDSIELKYRLENWLTRNGGIVSVCLVITEMKSDETEMELYSFPAVINIQSKPYGHQIDDQIFESVSVLSEQVKENALKTEENAEKANENAEESKYYSQESKLDAQRAETYAAASLESEKKAQLASLQSAQHAIDATAALNETRTYTEAAESYRNESYDSAGTAQYYSNISVNKAEEASGFKLDAKNFAGEAERFATVAENAADRADESLQIIEQKMNIAKNLANALKGYASGKIVSIKDVSPLEHDIKVKLSGVSETPEYNLTIEKTLIEKGSNVAIAPTQSVRVVFTGGAYCVGGLAPMCSVEGSEPVAIKEIALMPYGSYAEMPGEYDITYTIADDTLYWEGNHKILWPNNPVIAEISGSYPLGSTNQKIQGFNQVYGIDAENPFSKEPDWEYANEQEYLTTTIDVKIYEVVTPKVLVMGKNFFDISKVKSNSYITNNGDGTIYVNVGSQSSRAAGTPNTLRDYAPNLKVGETYFLSGYSTPIDNALYDNNYIYLSGTGANVTWMFNDATKGKLKITEDLLNAKVLWYAWGKTNKTTTISNIQIELGKTATEYELYLEPMSYNANIDGTVDNIDPLPSLTIIPDDEDLTVDVHYNRDINKAFAELQNALISLGGNF